MNAVDRLWRALGHGDWAAMAAQLGPGARIERPGEGTLGAEDYVAGHRAAGAPESIRRHRSVGDGTIVVSEDGKTRTVKSTMKNAKGEKVTSTLAYDKS